MLWYVSYGSNMHAGRLRYYLDGGAPPGALRTCPGCRDASPPRRVLPHCLPGGVYFATESETWTGGRAFYDPALPGAAAARAYLVTPGQFSDIAAQEMYREPGEDLDLTEVLAHGRQELGPGRYETLLYVGERDGFPVLTFTAPWSAADVVKNPPAPAYLRMLASGLAEGHGWTPERIGAYLAALPGAAGVWSAEAIAGLVMNGERRS
ncbi:histone deacetylase [Amycolatopsis sp.]|uniref:histone deacetylase n=1 Tax=Amycolatopsis sp. TaxID=37632 RepID=UPI002C23A248|nr:histone deacetylase [Amycolatopsis sp.]HVV11906.1 histone deacetylase [Amycolatopsis sp.]